MHHVMWSNHTEICCRILPPRGWILIALCSDIGPLLLRSSSVGVSRVPNPPAQCLKQASRGWSNFIDYRSRGNLQREVDILNPRAPTSLELRLADVYEARRGFAP
jgi:hypothetical protein